MSSYGSALFILVTSVFFSAASVVIVRRRVPIERLTELREVAGLFSALLGAIYAVLAAFLVVVVWGNYSDTRAAVHGEANRLSDLARLAKHFSAQDEAKARVALTSYARTMIDQEWPAMYNQEESNGGWRATQHLWRVYREIEPRDDRQQAVYAESLDALSDVSDFRRLRLAAAHEHIGGMMWVLLTGGGLLLIALTWCFAPPSLRAHVLMTAALAAVIGFNLFVIYALDHPFSSAPGISADPLQDAVVRIADPNAE